MRIDNMSYSTQLEVVKEMLTPRHPVSWLGLLAMLAFASFGLYEIGGRVLDRANVYSWEEVQGEIIEIEDLGGSNRVRVYYSYSFDGELYSGSNVDASRLETTTVSSREKARLSSAFQNNKPIPVRVNKNNPHYSFYDMRWYELYVEIFICSLLFLFISLYGYVFFSLLFGKKRNLK